jgi:rubrerythrin
MSHVPSVPTTAAALSDITYETSRRGFLSRTGALAGGGALVALLAACGDDTMAAPDMAVPVLSLPLQNDTDILKYALFLELLEADFYAKALASGALSGLVASLAADIGAHEATHVQALSGALGSDAFGPSDVGFDFGNSFATPTAFLATAQTLEQTGVRAYLGALGQIQSRALRTTAGSIFTVEARHVAAIRALTNATGGPVPNAFESGETPENTVSAVVATGFVTRGLG